MMLGSRNLEWILTAGLTIGTIIAFLLISGGLNAQIPETLRDLLLVMIFAAQLIVAIILLRIYEALLNIGKAGKR